MSGASEVLVMLSAQNNDCNRNLPCFLIVQGRKGMNSTASSHSSKGYSSAQLLLEKHLWRPKSSAAPGNVKAVVDRSIQNKTEPAQLEKVADDESRCHTVNSEAAAPTLKHFRKDRPSSMGAHVTRVTKQQLKTRGTPHSDRRLARSKSSCAVHNEDVPIHGLAQQGYHLSNKSADT